MASATNAIRLKVFISYSRRDTPFADELLAVLQVCGFEPYLDRHDIAPGEAWEDRLDRLIHEADTVVFVVSPHSVKSQRCIWEIERTQTLGKRLLPVVWRAVSEQDTPLQLRRLNYIFFEGEGRTFAQGLVALADALNTDVEWIRENTRLSELAVRWDAHQRTEAYLIRGEDLANAKNLLASRPKDAPEPTSIQREYLAASENAELDRINREKAVETAMRDAEFRRVKAEQEAERLRLESEKAQAESAAAIAESKRRRTQIIFAAAAAVVAVLMAVGGYYAYGERQVAIRERMLADRERKLAEAQLELEKLKAQGVAAAQTRATLPEVATSLPGPTAPAGPAAPVSPVSPRISQDAIDMMLAFEVGNRQTYERLLIHPKLEAGAGLMIGIAYSLGFVTAERFRQDWSAYLDAATVERLSGAAGVKDDAARALAGQFADITISWDTALAQFTGRTIPQFAQAADNALPNTRELSPDSFGALVSLALSLGPGGLRPLRDAMAGKQFAAVPALIRQARAPTPGLKARREAEAKLFEKGLIR